MSLTKTAAIPFFRATVTRQEWQQLGEVEAHPELLGAKHFSAKSIEILEALLRREVMLVKSGTQALELAAVLCPLRPGDEVIMPSFGFVSCANAFALQGAKIVFTDIRPDTMNIDENLIEAAITPRTKAILTINYSGVACEYDQIQAIAEKHRLVLVEDNAHGIWATYKNRPLGSFGDFATISFDHLKNITCGQGGAIAFNKKSSSRQLEYYSEFGTNKAAFVRGESPTYEWKGPGSNFYLSELLCAFLYGQLQHAEQIITAFRSHWDAYVQLLKSLEKQGLIQLPVVPAHCRHNAHNFFIKTHDLKERTALISYLRSQEIHATFHYVPLHSSEFGLQAGRFHGEDKFTTAESERLLRLPLYYDLTPDDIERVCACVYEFYGKRPG